MSDGNGIKANNLLSTFSSREFLRLLESCGMTGNWGWNFATGDHVWSSGLFRLLGLSDRDVTPSYEILLSLIHPDDRLGMESAAEIVRDGILRNRTVRIIRPDGTLRVLESRGEVYHHPDGRPRSAAGIILDVTDQNRMARAYQMDRQQRWALFEQVQTWINGGAYTLAGKSGSNELLSLTGLSQDEFQEDCLRVIVPEDRPRVRGIVRAMLAAGKPFTVTKQLSLATGGHDAFRFIYAPVKNENNQILSWATLASRASGHQMEPVEDIRRGLEQGVTSAHIRAARGLLDWSMKDLAQASGLSFTTVRRLEEGHGIAGRSSHIAIAALRQAGIGFILIEGNKIAIVKN